MQVLQPGEFRTIFWFGNPEAEYYKFTPSVSGHFEKEIITKNENTPPYKILGKRVGEGYITFWVATEHMDDQSLLAISKEFKNNYADAYKLGFQVRFQDPKLGIVDDALAVYALTKWLKLSRLRSFIDGTDRVVADDI